MSNPENRWKKTFFTIWAGQAFSILGSSAAQFAVIWWLTIQTGSAVVLAMASMVSFLPMALIGPFAGAWVDRLSRKTVMIAADLLIAAASAVLAAAFLLGTPAMWLIYLILFLRAVGLVFHAPAMQAALPMLVPQSELTKIGGWNQLVQSGSLMLGPALGTMVMTAFSIPAVMLLDILGAAAAIITLVLVKIPDPERNLTAKQNIGKEMLEGLKEIHRNQPLKAITVTMILSSLIYVPLGSLFPLMVSEHFGGTAWHASAVQFLFASGLLVSSLILGIWGGIKDKFLMINLAIGSFGIIVAVAGALPPSAFITFAILCVLIGLIGNFVTVPYIAYIQSTVPPTSLGRVFAIVTSLMSFASPLGLFVAGPVANQVGIASWFLISGLLEVMIALMGHALSRKVPASNDMC